MTSLPWSLAPLFGTLKAEQRHGLEGMAQVKQYSPGHVIFLESEPCTGFFVVVEGAVQLTRAAAEGACPTLALVLPVDSFAEAAMFGDEAFPATATAIKPTTVVHFPKSLFLRALREDPELAIAIIQAQAVWLRKLTQQVERLSSTDSFERLRQWLREQLPTQGMFHLPVTKKALAAQLGMAPETLSRGLRSLQDMGLIQVQGQSIRRTAPF